ncbi:MAG: hypothetical protein FWG43_05115 [Clostridiales bacterium]|nr:hypothetical protein [Clostridiales bacterium]
MNTKIKFRLVLIPLFAIALICFASSMPITASADLDAENDGAALSADRDFEVAPMDNSGDDGEGIIDDGEDNGITDEDIDDLDKQKNTEPEKPAGSGFVIRATSTPSEDDPVKGAYKESGTHFNSSIPGKAITTNGKGNEVKLFDGVWFVPHQDGDTGFNKSWDIEAREDGNYPVEFTLYVQLSTSTTQNGWDSYTVTITGPGRWEIPMDNPNGIKIGGISVITPPQGTLEITKELLGEEEWEDNIFTFNVYDIIDEGFEDPVATIEIGYKDGAFTSNPASLDISAGYYAVKEVIEGKSYMLDHTVGLEEGVVLIEEGETVRVKFVNKFNEQPIKQGITIIKQGSGTGFVDGTFNFQIEEYIGGEWVVLNMDEDISVTTVEREGEVFIELSAGTFRVTEINADASYTVTYTPENRIVTVEEAEVSEITVTNHRDGGGNPNGNTGGGRDRDPVTPVQRPQSIPDSEVPLSESPKSPSNIPEPNGNTIIDNDIPLGNLPQTGDSVPFLQLCFVLLGSSLVGMGLLLRTWHKKQHAG